MFAPLPCGHAQLPLYLAAFLFCIHQADQWDSDVPHIKSFVFSLLVQRTQIVLKRLFFTSRIHYIHAAVHRTRLWQGIDCIFSHKKSLHGVTPCGFPWSEITACEKISRLKVMETEVFKLRCCDAKSNKKPPVWFCAGLIGTTLRWEESFIVSWWNYLQSREWR